MKGHELAKMLLALPDLEVKHIWDGSAYTTIECVWVAQGGFIATADHGEVVYSNKNRPEGAPDKNINPYWRTAGNGGW